MSAKKKLVKKRPSLAKQIKDLKERLDNLRKSRAELFEEMWDSKKKLEAIKDLFPKKYYKITYRANCNIGIQREYNETKMSIHPHLIVLDLMKRCGEMKGFEFLTIIEVAQ